MQKKFFLSIITKDILLKKSALLISLMIIFFSPNKVIAQQDSNYKALPFIARVTDGGPRNLLFLKGSLKLTDKSYKELAVAVKILKDNPGYKLDIEGHTDDVGNENINQILSENRANTVKVYLISKGIEDSRLTAKGFGESRPVANKKTKSGRVLNNRVEFILHE